jgi:hypothetical protein
MKMKDSKGDVHWYKRECKEDMWSVRLTSPPAGKLVPVGQYVNTVTIYITTEETVN